MYRISHSNYNYRNREKWITSKHIQMQLRGLNGTKKINIFEQIAMEFNIQHPLHTHIEDTPSEWSHINIHSLSIHTQKYAK